METSNRCKVLAKELVLDTEIEITQKVWCDLRDRVRKEECKIINSHEEVRERI